MYSFTTRSKKAEKQFYAVLELRPVIKQKLRELQSDPRNLFNAHKLKGKLAGKWSCYLGYDIRIVYEIDDSRKEIVVVAAGTHKVAYN